ncbi:hypothetical protein SDC9_210814 [bioreactor metagenome]|uniref:Uncharacterized protein n=1 Tax=bioreactor metagenome TaxID=1076179 RepID=A0A645JIW7_9ZZZZ
MLEIMYGIRCQMVGHGFKVPHHNQEMFWFIQEEQKDTDMWPFMKQIRLLTIKTLINEVFKRLQIYLTTKLVRLIIGV